MMHAIVIGAGFGGIAAALRLRAKGYDVTIFDQCAAIGGRAQTYMRDGFTHDAGPTVITAPFLFDELFALYGKSREDYVTFIPLDPWYRFVFDDGMRFDYARDPDILLDHIARIHPPDVAHYQALLAMSEQIYHIGFDTLADQPFHSPLKMASILPDLLRLKGYKSVWSLVSSYLENDYLRRAFSIQPLLVGGNPFDTSAIYCLIHYLERKWGVWFAKGGTTALVAALQRLMEEAGITIRTSTPIANIIIRNRVACGVVDAQGTSYPADKVISNADPAFLYTHMIGAEHRSLSVRIKQRAVSYSMGLFVLYFGTTRTYPDVAHHTIWMGERYRGLLHDIFHRKILTEDVSLYLHRPSATDPSFAPQGCDSFYVLAPVPNLQADIDWREAGPMLRDRIVEILDAHLLPGLHNTITADFYKTPEDFRHDYSSMHGAGFSIAPVLTQSAWFRFHNKAEGIANLYLTGAGTHPGAGLPGVISSAKVIDRLIPDAA